MTTINNTAKSKKIKGILFFTIILIFFTIIGILVGKPMIQMASNPAEFRNWVDRYGIWGRTAFVGMIFIQNVIAIIPGEPLEICAGYAFGAVEGTILCIIGSVIGSVTVFLFVRRFGIKLVEIFFSKEKLDNLKFLHNTRRLNIFVLIFTLIPGTPKDLMSYFVGLTKMKLSIWIFITAVGRIPSIVTSTIGGDGLGNKQYMTAIIVFGVTMLISLFGLAIYNYICKKTGSEPDENSEN